MNLLDSKGNVFQLLLCVSSLKEREVNVETINGDVTAFIDHNKYIEALKKKYGKQHYEGCKNSDNCCCPPVKYLTELERLKIQFSELYTNNIPCSITRHGTFKFSSSHNLYEVENNQVTGSYYYEKSNSWVTKMNKPKVVK